MIFTQYFSYANIKNQTSAHQMDKKSMKDSQLFNNSQDKLFWTKGLFGYRLLLKTKNIVAK